jgi:hypothetical protein
MRGINMRREEIKYFLGKNVKIVYQNDFYLKGVIRKIFEESILFYSQRNKASIIPFTELKIIAEV